MAKVKTEPKEPKVPKVKKDKVVKEVIEKAPRKTKDPKIEPGKLEFNLDTNKVNEEIEKIEKKKVNENTISNKTELSKKIKESNSIFINSNTGEIDMRMPIEAVQREINANKSEDLLVNASKETIVTKPEALTYQAKKWLDYLNYLKWTPEDFLVKYPNHKFKEFIQEIIDFNKNL